MGTRRTSAGALVVILAWTWIGSATAGEIHDAVKNGDVETVKVLLKENPALVNDRDNRGRTPLHLAAAHEQEEIAKLLLAKKADVNAKDKDGCTPLHEAAQNGSGRVAKVLLSTKADVKARSNFGDTPLHDAADDGSVIMKSVWDPSSLSTRIAPPCPSTMMS